MPVWFFLLLLGIVLVALVLAVGMGFGRRNAGGQNTTIVERPTSDATRTTVVEND